MMIGWEWMIFKKVFMSQMKRSKVTLTTIVIRILVLSLAALCNKRLRVGKISEICQITRFNGRLPLIVKLRIVNIKD